LERNLIGAGIRLAAQVATKDRLSALFRTEAQRAIDSARLLSEEKGRRRVLVPRLLGIEDSSRNWSVYMVLEHLVIVNSAIAATLPRLYAGRGVSTEVRAEEVSPLAEAGPEQMDDLAKLVERYTDMVEKLGNLRAGIAHPHIRIPGNGIDAVGGAVARVGAVHNMCIGAYRAHCQGTSSMRYIYSESAAINTKGEPRVSSRVGRVNGLTNSLKKGMMVASFRKEACGSLPTAKVSQTTKAQSSALQRRPTVKPSGYSTSTTPQLKMDDWRRPEAHRAHVIISV
jgi:hypothetical protein